MGASKNRKIKAFTLIEVAIFMAAAGLILGGIWVGASHVRRSSLTSRVNEQVLAVAQNVRSYYGTIQFFLGAGGLADITALVDADALRLVPTEMRSTPNVSGNALNHALGSRTGGAGAGSFHVWRLTDTAFRIQLLDLAREECIRILMTFPGHVHEIGVTRMGTASLGTNVDVQNVSSPGSPYDVPLSPGDAGMMCSGATNEVRFDFKLFN